MSTISTAVESPETDERKRRPGLSDRARGERNLGWKLAGPAFVIMLLVTLYPIAYAIYLSLFSYRLTDPEARRFVFLQNYTTALTDPLFWEAFVTTFIIVVVTLVIELVLGMAIAMLMHRVVIPRRTLRTVVLIPYAIITVVSAFSWLFAAQVGTGFFNHWLNAFTFGAFPLDYDWFGGRWSALTIICLSEIWKTTPFISLLLLAGLVQVPEDMQEAAKVDGATAWQRLWKVTLPNMKAAIMVALLFRTLDAWRIFDNPYVMTAGANNTETISFLAYRQNVTLVNLGMGSAVSVLLFLSVVAIAWVFIKVFKTDLSQVRGDQ